MRILLLAIAILPATFADTFNSYAVSEHGGMSQALPLLRSDLFWWVYNTEGGSGLAFSTQEYAPSTAALFAPLWSGSVLPSSSFSHNGRDTLPVRTAQVSPQTGEIDTVGFTSLLQDSALAAVLFNLRPNSGIRRGDIPSPLTHYFVPATPPPRLTLISSNRLFWPDTHVILGGNASGAGTDQLHFGEYSLGDTWITDLPAAMVVNSAAAPEPASESWLILAFGLGTVIARGRWRYTAGSARAALKITVPKSLNRNRHCGC
jgi:hypothetical protein